MELTAKAIRLKCVEYPEENDAKWVKTTLRKRHLLDSLLHKATIITGIVARSVWRVIHFFDMAKASLLDLFK